MRGAGHTLTLRYTKGAVSVVMASGTPKSLDAKVRDEIADLDAKISVSTDPAQIAKWEAAKGELQTVIGVYDASRQSITARAREKGDAWVKEQLTVLGSELAEPIMAIAGRYGLTDFARDAFGVTEKLQSIRAQVEEQIEKHKETAHAVGDRMAYTAHAAEVVLGWQATTGQLHTQKTLDGQRNIRARLKELDELREHGLDFSQEEWYVRGKEVADRCSAALADPRGFLYARGKDVLKHFIDDMAARGMTGNARAVADAKRHLGMP